MFNRIRKWWRSRNTYDNYMGTIDSIRAIVLELEAAQRKIEREEKQAEACRHVDGLDKVIEKKRIRKIRGE